MKIKYLVFILAVVFAGSALQSCEKYHGDTYDFSDSQADYMTFAYDEEEDGPLQINADIDTTTNTHIADTLSVDIVTRMNLVSEVNYTYSYQIDGGSSVEVQGVYPANATSASIKVYTTDAMFPAGKDKITGKIILTGASTEAGDLTIGYPDSTAAMIDFTAYKPGS